MHLAKQPALFVFSPHISRLLFLLRLLSPRVIQVFSSSVFCAHESFKSFPLQLFVSTSHSSLFLFSCLSPRVIQVFSSSVACPHESFKSFPLQLFVPMSHSSLFLFRPLSPLHAIHGRGHRLGADRKSQTHLHRRRRRSGGVVLRRGGISIGRVHGEREGILELGAQPPLSPANLVSLRSAPNRRALLVPVIFLW
jgi:hypothetical protein